MLVKQAEQEATARGLPPTPSNEAIARVFGEYGEARDGDDPDVWGPPRPSPGKGPSLNRSRASPSTQRPASAAPRSPGAPTRLAASVTAGPRAQRSRNTEHEARDAARTKRGASDASDAAPENAHSPPMTKTKPSVKAAALVVRERASAAGEASFTSSTKQPTTETTEAAGQPGRVRPATARAGTTRARSPYASAAVPGSPPRSKQTEAKGIKPVPATRRGRRRLRPPPCARRWRPRRRPSPARSRRPARRLPRRSRRASRPPWTSPTGRTRGRWRRCLARSARRAEALTRGERSADAEPAASAAAAGSGSQSARPTAASAKADASRRAGPVRRAEGGE